MASRRCGRPGCRAWAMRGTRFCYAHRFDEETAATAEPELTAERRIRSEAFADAVRQGRQDEMVERTVRKMMEISGGDRTLEQEIGALRLVLQRVIAVDMLDGDVRETANTVARLADSIVRAVRAQRAISGDLAGDLSDALTTVLIEMGLGDEE